MGLKKKQAVVAVFCGVAYLSVILYVLPIFSGNLSFSCVFVSLFIFFLAVLFYQYFERTRRGTVVAIIALLSDIAIYILRINGILRFQNKIRLDEKVYMVMVILLCGSLVYYALKHQKK